MQLSQYFDLDTTNPLLRLEPIDSMTRIVEDRIYRTSPDGPIDDTGNYDVNGDLISSGWRQSDRRETDSCAIGRPESFCWSTVKPRVAGGGTASAAEVPVLFDDNSILDYSFDDVLLYVNTGTSLEVVNPFTGEQYLPGSSHGSFGGEFIRDVAFRANGELFGYTDNGPIPRTPPASTCGSIPPTRHCNGSVRTGIQTFHLTNFDPHELGS